MIISKASLKALELLAECGPERISVAREDLMELVLGYRRYRWLKANARDAGMWDDASIDAAMEQKA